MDKKVVFVTGAASGIGLACAKLLHELGFHVFGTYRREPAPDSQFSWVPMDVRDDGSVQEGITAVIHQTSRIDILINNAGYALAGAVEDTSVAEAQAQFDTNFFGAMRVIQAVLPIMRQQQSGLIINMSSLAGAAGLPFTGFYCASKFALEGMSEALRLEVKPFGIQVVLVEPGDFCTNVTNSRHVAAEAKNNSPYWETFDRAFSVIEANEREGEPPTAVAEKVLHIIQTNSPKPRYRVGKLLEVSGPYLKMLLPWRTYEKIVLDYYDLD